MSEDDKPLYDIESYWNIIYNNPDVQVFKHNDYEHLLRVVDFKNQEIRFTDQQRILTKNVIDINKPIPEVRKSEIIRLVMRVIDAEKPITMPYKKERLKVYIEDLGAYIGILYYMDSDKEKTLVPIKRFFNFDDRHYYSEVSFDEYNSYKEEHIDVDQNTEQTENS